MNPQRGAGARKSAAKNRTRDVSPARRAAFEILLAVESGHAHSDELLRGAATRLLSVADRNLATALVWGVLRWQIRIDHELRSLLARPAAKLESEVLIALRIGAFQILNMDRIPARAAIDESVELVKRAGHRFASGMVNAVLRKLSAAPRRMFPDGSVAEIALAEAHPEWMVERWARFYGVEAARAICRHGQKQPVLALRLGGEEVEEQLTAAGIVLEPGSVLSASRNVVGGDLSSAAAFEQGRVRAQDEGSQLVAELAAACGDDVSAILDACAAPGGKTLILAERFSRARIVACESSPTRLEQLRTRLAPWGDRVECRNADASALTEEAAYDLVLVDVPCSGSGTLGRNPEIRHRLRPEDLTRQADRQRAILAAALRAVRPGGRVVYSTCSLEPEENEQLVSAVVDATPSARIVSLRGAIDFLLGNSILRPAAGAVLHSALTQEGALSLLPGLFRTDGFYVGFIERCLK